MKKKVIKRVLVTIVATTMIMGSMIGCGAENSKETSTNVEHLEEKEEPKKDKEYTLSELFASKERVWLYVDAEAMGGVIDKNGQVSGIFVTYPDGTLRYTYGSEEIGLKTIGEYSQMTDEEIIQFVEENPIDSRITNGFASDEMLGKLTEYGKSNKMKYSFNITTDHTGNEVNSEQLVYQKYPSVISYQNPEGGLFDGEPGMIGYTSFEDILSRKCNMEDVIREKDKQIWTYNYGLTTESFYFNSLDSLEKAVVYETNYFVLKAANDIGYDFLITRYDEDEEVVIKYDSMGTEGISIDKEGKDILSSEVIFTEQIDYFWKTNGDVNSYLEGYHIEVSWLVRQGFVDLLFEHNMVDKDIFSEKAKQEYEAEMLSDEEYNELIQKGYVNN